MLHIHRSNDSCFTSLSEAVNNTSQLGILHFDGRKYGPGDSLDLELGVQGQTSDLNGRACRLVVAKELGIDSVDSYKVIHIRQKDLKQTKV